MSTKGSIELEREESIWDAPEEQTPMDEEEQALEADSSSLELEKNNGAYEEAKVTYAEQAKLEGAKYIVTDVPPLGSPSYSGCNTF